MIRRIGCSICQALDRELARARRERRSLCIVIIDAVGAPPQDRDDDARLWILRHELALAIRAGDEILAATPSRLLLLLRGLTREHLTPRMRLLRAHAARVLGRLGDPDRLRWGAAVYPHDGQSLATLLAHADAALAWPGCRCIDNCQCAFGIPPLASRRRLRVRGAPPRPPSRGLAPAAPRVGSPARRTLRKTMHSQALSPAIEILLVEDDPDDVELTLRALRRGGLGNPIVVARDGQEALDHLFFEGRFADRRLPDRPRLVLLDLKLPRVDGIEVLRRIKGDERTRSIPTVILTSSMELQHVVGSYELGVNSYIVKPVSFEQFSAAVQKLGMYWLLVNQPPPRADADPAP